MGHQKIRSLRVLALGLSLALAMIGLFTWAPLGHAAPSTDTVVNPNKKGSITVHSIAGEPISSVTSDGTEKTLSSAKPLNGSIFKLTKSNIDVSTLSGMKQAKSVTVTSGFTTDSTFAEKTCTTTGNGACKFDQLLPGVYKLEQTTAPAGHQTAIPAIVILPLTNPQGTGFIYDIHVYPKNSELGKITKVDTTPKGTFLKEGAQMTFKITVPVPKHDGNQFESFTITDTPKKGFEVDTNLVDSMKVGDTKLEAADYSVSMASNGKDAVITFTSSSGLSKIQSAAANTLIEVNVKGKVKNIATDGAVQNGASYTYKFKDGKGGGTGTTEGDKDEPNVTFGYVKIKNVDGSDALTGGAFTVGKCNAAGTDIVSGDGNVVKTGATTSDDKIGPIGPLTGAKLCVKQTKAPDTYALNSSATAVDFGAEQIKNATSTNPMEITVTNTKASDFLSKLPLTGGPGVIAFLVGGALLLIAAVATMVRKRRQDQE